MQSRPQNNHILGSKYQEPHAVELFKTRLCWRPSRKNLMQSRLQKNHILSSKWQAEKVKLVQIAPGDQIYTLKWHMSDKKDLDVCSFNLATIWN